MIVPSGSKRLTNKIIDADLNTLSNIDNSEVKAAAAIAESKLAFDTTSGHDHDGSDSKALTLGAGDIAVNPALWGWSNVYGVIMESHDRLTDGVDERLQLGERGGDPSEPGEGQFVIWMSDGTGKGDDGDVLIASKAGGVTKWGTFFDHSAGGAW